MKHWIAMSGEHGCLPQHCQSADSLRAAVDDLASLHELSRRQQAELRRTGSVELRRDQGAEYAEVSECGCADASVHDDN